MSWRLLIFTILVFAAVATALGLQAGDYLIGRVPVQANIPNVTELDPPAEYDEQGQLIIPQPMQPLLDGTQGLASAKPDIDWKIQESNLEEALKNEEDSAMYAEENLRLSGVVTQGSTGNTLNLQPLRRQQPTQGSGGSGGDNLSWVGAFNQAMTQYCALGFNERPSCISRVRNQYCCAINAWVRFADCPAR